MRAMFPATPDPSPEEIVAACAEIRRGWPAGEHYRRQIAMPGYANLAQSNGEWRHWHPPMIELTRKLSAVVETA